MVPRGLEPRTLRLFAVLSNQLSYETVEDPGLTFETVCLGDAGYSLCNLRLIVAYGPSWV